MTVVATGLSRPNVRRTAPPLTVLRTGTDNVPFHVPTLNMAAGNGAGITSMGATGGGGLPPLMSAQPNYAEMDRPSVWRTGRTSAAAKVDALSSGGMDDIEIPAFLRRQAD